MREAEMVASSEMESLWVSRRETNCFKLTLKFTKFLGWFLVSVLVLVF